ncbi:hypothetical protein FQR65_LT00274 [Abscondita terminalis]|nr:hypothetical protein FQR65_LT00274 [Abscondita terminalis]
MLHSPKKLALEAIHVEKHRTKLKTAKRKLVELDSLSSTEDEFSEVSSEYDESMNPPITGFEKLDKGQTHEIGYIRRKDEPTKFCHPTVPEITSVYKAFFRFLNCLEKSKGKSSMYNLR